MAEGSTLRMDVCLTTRLVVREKMMYSFLLSCVPYQKKFRYHVALPIACCGILNGVVITGLMATVWPLGGYGWAIFSTLAGCELICNSLIMLYYYFKESIKDWQHYFKRHACVQPILSFLSVLAILGLKCFTLCALQRVIVMHAGYYQSWVMAFGLAMASSGFVLFQTRVALNQLCAKKPRRPSLFMSLVMASVSTAGQAGALLFMLHRYHSWVFALSCTALIAITQLINRWLMDITLYQSRSPSKTKQSALSAFILRLFQTKRAMPLLTVFAMIRVGVMGWLWYAQSRAIFSRFAHYQRFWLGFCIMIGVVSGARAACSSWLSLLRLAQQVKEKCAYATPMAEGVTQPVSLNKPEKNAVSMRPSVNNNKRVVEEKRPSAKPA